MTKLVTPNTLRKIIHLDMDAFFASVEQRDNPSYQGKPLIVGGNPNGRGVVAAASYEARAFGIHSAMSCYEAKKRCPHAIFVRPRFDIYRHVSQTIHSIMLTLTPLVEPLSLDEAYLDVTGQSHHHGSATLMAEYLRQAIFEQTQLTVSAGVSFNKMLAKIASNINKPNGITVITPEIASSFLDALPIETFFGIGKASSQKLKELNVHTGLDLKQLELPTLIDLFGQKRGHFYYQIAHGIDERPVEPERKRKSIGAETTFSTNLTDDTLIFRHIIKQNQDAFDQLQKRKLTAHTITLKIKYSDFSQLTRSHSLPTCFKDEAQAERWLWRLFMGIPRQLPIRLVGVTFSNFDSADSDQLELFG